MRQLQSKKLKLTMATPAEKIDSIQHRNFNKISIKPFRLEHLDAVMNIEPFAFGPNHWSRQIFVNELNNTSGTYFVATDVISANLLGYSGFWLIGEEAHITTLAVHPDHQKKYIGERLLINNIVQSRQLGARWLTLEVRVSNEPAQRLYEKYGFKKLGVRPSYYLDNLESAYILWSENTETLQFKELLNERISNLKERIGE